MFEEYAALCQQLEQEWALMQLEEKQSSGQGRKGLDDFILDQRGMR